MVKPGLLARSWSVRTGTLDSETTQEGFSSGISSIKRDSSKKKHGLRRSLSAPRVLYRTRSRKQTPNSKGNDPERLHCDHHLALSSCQGISVNSPGDFSQRFSPDVVGIALGSPKKDLPSLPPEAAESRIHSSLAEHFLSYNSVTLHPRASCREDGSNLKTRTSRWKRLGVFFGKKDAHVPDQLLASSCPTSYARPNIRKHEFSPRRRPSDRRNAARDRGWSKSILHTEQKNGFQRTRTGMKRSQTTPLPLREEKSPTPPPKDLCFLATAPHLLHVNIPNSEMERYSVMFSNLLEFGLGQERSTLLARRQGHLEKLRYAGDNNHENNHSDNKFNTQKAIGPVYSLGARSTSSSLLPSTPPDSGRRLPDKPKPIAKPSPFQLSPTVPDVVSDHSAGPIILTGDLSRFNFMFHSPAPSPTSTTITQHKRREPELSSSPATIEWCFTNAPEPESKQIRSFPPSRKDSLSFRKYREDSDFIGSKILSTTVERECIVSGDSASTPSTQSAQEAEQPVARVTEISIARQISVSRQQRQILIPIVPQIARHPIKPALVDVGSTESLRRSHHVLLENV